MDLVVQEQQKNTIEQAKSLLKKGCYKQAKLFCESNWGPINSWIKEEQLRISSTIYAHLGGDRNSDAITLRLYRSHKSSPKVLFDYWYYKLNNFGSILAQELFDKTKALIINTEYTEDVIAFEAILKAQFNNFDQAEELLSNAQTQSDNKIWFETIRIRNLISQDNFEAAFDLASELYESSPRISTLRAYFNAKQQVKGLKQATSFLLNELPKYESASLWLECASSLADLLDWENCNYALSQYESLKFDDDKQSRKTFKVLKGQCLLNQGKLAEGKALLEKSKLFYWQKVCENIDSFDDSTSKIDSAIKKLDVPFIRQKHLTCAPTSMSAICHFYGIPIDSQAIANEICFDGTHSTKERQWLRNNGFDFVEFELEKSILVNLIDCNIPFALVTTDGFNAHMQVVMGYNLRHGTMFIMDPSSTAMQEMLIQETIEKEVFTGARCIAFVPNEKKDSLSFIQTTCSHLFPIYDKYELAKIANNTDEMLSAVNEMSALSNDHRLTLVAKRNLACFYNDLLEIQKTTEQLLKIAPHETVLLNSKYYYIRDLQSRQEAINWLSSNLKDQFNLTLSEVLFNELSKTNEQPILLAEQLKILKRYGYKSPSVFNTLGQYYWQKQAFQKANDCFFISHNMDDTDTEYVESYFKTANILGKSQLAIEWLQKRVNKYQSQSPLPSISLYRSMCTLNREQEGIKVLKSSLILHPSDTQLISTLANALADIGDLESLRKLLDNKKEFLSKTVYLNLKARLYEMQGLLEKASSCFKEIFIDTPLLFSAANNYFRSLNKLGRQEKLNSELELLISKYSEVPDVYFYLTDWHSSPSYLKLQLERILLKRPENWHLRKTLINTLVELNDYKEALEQAKTANDMLNGSYQEAQLARCYFFNEDFPSAIQLAKKVLTKDVDNETALWILDVTATSIELKEEHLDFVRNELSNQHSMETGIWHYWNEAQNIAAKCDLEDFINTLLNDYSNDWSTYCIASQFYSKCNDADKAFEVLNLGQLKLPLVPRLYTEQADLELAEGNIDAAIESNIKALSINPAWDRVSKNLADLYEKQGKIELAFEVIKNGLKHNGQDGILHGFYADYAYKLGFAEDAHSHLITAIRLHTNYTWAWGMLKKTSAELGYHDRLAELASELIKSQPHIAASWRFAAYATNQISEKENYLKQGLEHDPMNEESLKQLADLLTNNGRFNDAIKLLESTPWGEQLPLTLAESKADFLAQTGKQELAAQTLWNAIKNQADHNKTWQRIYELYRSFLTLDKSYEHKIIKAANRQIELNPHSPEHLCVAAEQILEFGDASKATALLERAYKLAPSDEYIVLTYIDRLIDLSEFEVALHCLENYEQFSIVSFALARKVNVLCQLGQIEYARKTFEQLANTDCEMYGTIQHAFNALSKHTDKLQLIDVLESSLTQCSQMQAYFWADKFIESYPSKVVDTLLEKMQKISSDKIWSGAFCGLVDYWQDKNTVPNIKLIELHKHRIHQDGTLIGRIIDLYMQRQHYYNVAAFMNDLSDRSIVPMSCLYQYAICLLMLGKHADATVILEEAKETTPDNTLHNLLVWQHAMEWINTKKIYPEEFNFIDKNELIESELHILKCLELMSSLYQFAGTPYIGDVQNDLKGLKKSYKKVKGLASSDFIHQSFLEGIKQLIHTNGFFDRLKLAWLTF